MATENSVKVIRFDWAIKRLLRDKANFDILEGFLAALLKDNNIKVLQILESESNQEEEDNKFNRVDILIQDGYDRKIIIEVQNTRESDYLERLLFGTSKTIVDHHQLGTAYKNISKLISISILYFNLGTGDDYLYYGNTTFKGMNTGTPLKVKKRIEVVTNLETQYLFEEKKIFPEYYLIQVEKYQNIIKQAIDEWVYIFKNNEVKKDFRSKNIDKVAQKLAEMNMSEEERKAYEAYLDALAREKDMIETAKAEGLKEGLKKGKEEGLKEGIEKGKEEGLKEGIEKGKEEGLKKGIEKGKEEEKVHTIITGYKAGLPLDLLATLTQFTPEKVQEIIDQHHKSE